MNLPLSCYECARLNNPFNTKVVQVEDEDLVEPPFLTTAEIGYYSQLEGWQHFISEDADGQVVNEFLCPIHWSNVALSDVEIVMDNSEI